MRSRLHRGMANALLILVLAGTGFVQCRQKSEHQANDTLLGGLTQEQIFEHFPSWREAFERYEPDSAAVAVIRQVAEPVEILVFLGTWCPDSEREVPRFMKTLAMAGNENIHVHYYGVPRGFREKDDAAAQYEIMAVPTFIVRRRALEIGRIVETPEVNVEADLAAILLESGVVGSQG